MTENRSRGPSPLLDGLLAAAARPAHTATEAEERAVAAFRAARDEGALSAPTRRKDDWRPAGPRVRIAPVGWIKAGLGTLVTGLTLGGVAMAAGEVPAPFGDTHDTPSPPTAGASSRQGVQTPGRGPSASPTAGPTARTPDERPPTAKDELAHCRVYESGQQGQGRAALAGTAWQRLEDAAGGPDAVGAYCARLLRGQPPQQPPKERQSKNPDGKADTSPMPADQRNGRGKGQTG